MKKFDFVANLKKFLILSLAIMLVGGLCNLIFGTKLAVAFKGGTEQRYSYEVKPDEAKLEKTVNSVLKGATVSFDKYMNKEVITIKLADDISDEQQKNLNTALNKEFKDCKLMDADFRTLSPSMGTKFLLRCLLAVALAAVLLVVYVTFRFRNIGGLPAAVAALIALVHDLLIVYFTFVIFGIELNENFVAVMLTILGYSLNDTIVIFDRIRTMRRRSDAPLSEVVNDSLHHVLRRTIVTTATTCVAILVVLIVAMVMHVDSIISFALPMLLGSISGSYSSLFLSGPIWVRWMEAREKKAAKQGK